MIRIVIADDQALVRAGFKSLLDAQPDMTVVGEAGDGEEAVRVAREEEPDVVLMDIRMPGVDGLEATHRISADDRLADTKVVILTTFDLDEYVVSAIKAGASGFLLKDAPPEDLLTAIRTVHAGDAVIAPSSTKRLLARLAATLPEPTDGAGLEDLTEREREVLTLMARGLSNLEICDALFLAEPTVKTHVGKILAKLGARDRVQAVIIAYETGLVRPQP